MSTLPSLCLLNGNGGGRKWILFFLQKSLSMVCLVGRTTAGRSPIARIMSRVQRNTPHTGLSLPSMLTVGSRKKHMFGGLRLPVKQ